MKNYSWLLIILFVGFLFLAIWGFTRIAIWPTWNLSASGQIGDTIGGITAPFINLLGAILVYLSFKQQQEANKIQIDANLVQMQELLVDREATNQLNKFNQFINIMNDVDELYKQYEVSWAVKDTANPDHGNIIKFIKSPESWGRLKMKVYNSSIQDPFFTNEVKMYLDTMKFMIFIGNEIIGLNSNDHYKTILELKFNKMASKFAEIVESIYHASLKIRDNSWFDIVEFKQVNADIYAVFKQLETIKQLPGHNQHFTDPS